MALFVPLQATPSQTLSIVLGGQACQINVYQKAYGLFLDLYVNGNLIIGGVLCLNLVPIVYSTYLGFIGDLIFGDTRGNNNPDYTGLNTRYFLQYVEAADIAALDLPPGVS